MIGLGGVKEAPAAALPWGRRIRVWQLASKLAWQLTSGLPAALLWAAGRCHGRHATPFLRPSLTGLPVLPACFVCSIPARPAYRMWQPALQSPRQQTSLSGCMVGLFVACRRCCWPCAALPRLLACLPPCGCSHCGIAAAAATAAAAARRGCCSAAGGTWSTRGTPPPMCRRQHGQCLVHAARQLCAGNNAV